MSRESRLLAGILLVILPTVMIGGVSLLTFLIDDPAYMRNPLRQDLWRAGHAHAGVLLILTLLALRYVDEAKLTNGLRWFTRLSIPSAAILLPVAFFFSVLTPNATEPNGFIYLAYVGALLLAAGVLTLGIGLLRGRDPTISARDRLSRRPVPMLRSYPSLLPSSPPEDEDPHCRNQRLCDRNCQKNSPCPESTVNCQNIGEGNLKQPVAE